MEYSTKVIVQSIQKRKGQSKNSLTVTFSPATECKYDNGFLCKLESRNQENLFEVFQEKELKVHVPIDFENILLREAEKKRPLWICFKKQSNSEKNELVEVRLEY